MNKPDMIYDDGDVCVYCGSDLIWDPYHGDVKCVNDCRARDRREWDDPDALH